MCPANPARFAQYARNVWGVQAADDEAAAQQGIERTEAYFASLGMPVSLGQARCGVQDEAGLQELAARCSFQKTRAIGTFRKLCLLYTSRAARRFACRTENLRFWHENLKFPLAFLSRVC